MEGRGLSEDLVGKYKRAEPTAVAAWGRRNVEVLGRQNMGSGRVPISEGDASELS